MSILRGQFKNLKNRKKGFTLIEVTVATAFFAIIVGGILLLIIRAIEANQKAEAFQIALENARFAAEGIGKKVRTTNSVSGTGFPTGGKKLFVIDNLDSMKYCYRFRDGNGDGLMDLELIYYNGPADSCEQVEAAAPTNVRTILSSKNTSINGTFYVKKSDVLANSPDRKRGLIMIVFDITYKPTATNLIEKESVKFQTTISLRDY